MSVKADTSQTIRWQSMRRSWHLRRIIKRLFDIIFSSFVLILTSPLFLCIALAIKFSSKGPIFYCQQRIGFEGKVFGCYKFRTMYENAESEISQLLESCPELQREWEQKRKLSKDPRVTSLGRFLRKTSLDEMPQFYNALKGELSVVGPRPVMKEELIEHFGVKAFKILSLKPGITGLWQVSGRSDLSYTERVEIEERYVDRHNLLLDLKIIFLTIPKMVTTKGAY